MDPQVVAKYLDYGVLGVTIVALISLLGVMAGVVKWAIGKWQGAEDQVDNEKEKRLEDTKVQAVLGVEFKNATAQMTDTVQKNTAEIIAMRGDMSKVRDELVAMRAELNARPAARRGV